MKRKIVLILLCSCLMGRAENVVHECVLQPSYSFVWAQDPYLSPLHFDGWLAGLQNEWWQPFHTDNRLGRKGLLDHWENTGYIRAAYGQQLSEVWSSRITSMILSSGWGAYYAWKWDCGVKVYAGPYLDFGLHVREHSSNVNKPYSVDLGIDAMALAGLDWCFAGPHSAYRLRYTIRTNLIGLEFYPDYWQSYYEISKSPDGTLHCGGVWNRHVVRHSLSLDLQFRYTTWRVGAEHEYMQYGSRDRQYISNTVSVKVGYLWSHLNLRSQTIGNNNK